MTITLNELKKLGNESVAQHRDHGQVMMNSYNKTVVELFELCTRQQTYHTAHRSVTTFAINDGVTEAQIDTLHDALLHHGIKALVIGVDHEVTALSIVNAPEPDNTITEADIEPEAQPCSI